MILAIGLLGCNGPDNELIKQTPHAAVFPDVVDFGGVPVEYSSSLSVTVQNTGSPTMTLTNVGTNDGEGVFTLGAFETEVPGGDGEIVIPVTYAPQQYTSSTATLAIGTDDPENPILSVTLLGTGIETPKPDIDVSPLSLDFGTVPAGVEGTLFFGIENVGDGALNLGEISLTGSGAFGFVGDVEGTALPPGQQSLVVVTYAPQTDLGENATLIVTSDDPDEPEVTVVLIGNGGGDFDYPLADIACPATAHPRETITLDGSGSMDPAGNLPLTYDWTLLSTPRGSTSALSEPSTQPLVYLWTDLAGEYEVELRVTNSIGLTGAPVTCVIDAIPTENLHVELTWETGNADFDLHLLNGSGILFTDPDDCNWCNPSPDWGVTAVRTDNPTLVLDDQYGYGPEEITIDEPPDDTYQVKVHYFSDHGDGNVTATVNIFTYGVLVASYQRLMSLNDVWDVAEVRFPEGLPVELSTDLYDSPLRGCQ